MSKEIYISSTPHETRLAIVESDELTEIYYERENEYTLAGSIYNGKVTRVLPGMQSSFVDIGLERDAFLYITDFMEEAGDSADFEVTDGGARSNGRSRGNRDDRGPAPEEARQLVEASAGEGTPTARTDDRGGNRADRPDRSDRSDRGGGERSDRSERSDRRGRRGGNRDGNRDRQSTAAAPLPPSVPPHPPPNPPPPRPPPPPPPLRARPSHPLRQLLRHRDRRRCTGRRWQPPMAWSSRPPPWTWSARRAGRRSRRRHHPPAARHRVHPRGRRDLRSRRLRVPARPAHATPALHPERPSSACVVAAGRLPACRPEHPHPRHRSSARSRLSRRRRTPRSWRSRRQPGPRWS